MSFSSNLKNELCQVRPSGSQKPAECYGLLMYSRGFSFDNISILTENEEVALRYARLLRLVADVSTRAVQSGVQKELTAVSVPSASDRAKIMHYFGYTKNSENLCINGSLVSNDADAGAYLRGAFLACGSVCDPNKEYHLEFSLSDDFAAKELMRLLISCGFAPREVSRERGATVYFKESGQIEDLLTFIGASAATLEIINIKIYKDFRNLANRRANAEVANISKTVAAAAKQLDAAAYLADNGILEELPPELAEAAKLRLENPELSLRDLAQLTEGSVSRSGMNHRLAKLIEIAENDRTTRKQENK